jgi:hypothetical protein
MTRKLLIASLILLAAVLPLAVLSVAVILVSLLFVVGVTLFVSANAQPAAFFALPKFKFELQQ